HQRPPCLIRMNAWHGIASLITGVVIGAFSCCGCWLVSNRLAVPGVRLSSSCSGEGSYEHAMVEDAERYSGHGHGDRPEPEQRTCGMRAQERVERGRG